MLSSTNDQRGLSPNLRAAARGTFFSLTCLFSLLALCLGTTPVASAEPDRLYDGLTLTEWRQRISELQPNSPQGAAAVPGLLEIVQDRDAPSFTRRQAALTLGRIGRRAASAVPVLVCLLEAEEERDDSTPVWAMQALALFGSEAKTAAPALVRVLHDESRPLLQRQVSLEALARIGAAHPAVVPALITTLEQGDSGKADPEAGDAVVLRELAAEALAVVGPDASASVPALIRATRDEREITRRKAAETLGAMGTAAEVAIPALIEVLAFDESAAVRDKAGEALARAGPGARPALEHLLQDPDAELRWRAAAGLGEMGPAAKPAATRLEERLRDESPQVRLNAAEALWKITADPAPIVPALVDDLTSSKRQIRMQAFRLLTEMGPHARTAVEPLKQLLDDGRPYVRQAASKALEKIESRD